MPLESYDEQSEHEDIELRYSNVSRAPTHITSSSTISILSSARQATSERWVERLAYSASGL